MFLELCGNVVSKEGIRVNGVYEVYQGLVEAVDLIAGSRAELENFALSDLDERGDRAGVFICDEAAGCGTSVSM